MSEKPNEDVKISGTLKGFVYLVVVMGGAYVIDAFLLLHTYNNLRIALSDVSLPHLSFLEVLSVFFFGKVYLMINSHIPYRIHFTAEQATVFILTRSWILLVVVAPLRFLL